MKFEELARYLERLEGTASRLAMTEILAELFKETDPSDARLVAYLTQGRLGPAYKSPDFGVADKMMLRALPEGADKIFKEVGDLGKTAEKLSDNKRGNLKVEEVYKKLWEIAEAGGEGSQEKKLKLIRDLLIDLDGLSAKYAVKMILGKLRTGFSDMTVLDSLSWMITGDKKLRPEIEAMYNVRADLGEIAEEVVRLRKPREIQPELGTPILMAQAERATSASEIWERNNKCALEYKLDGLRIQAHIKKGEVTLFSRGLENVTGMYPDVAEGLSGQIKHECIVEGEMIALDARGKFLPFQETAQRKRKYDITEMRGKIPLTIYVFDVLYVDGKSVMFEANEKRRELLEKMVSGSGKSTVRVMPRIVGKTILEIEEFFKKALKDGTEGIIAKKLDGAYQAGARDFNWIKYKKSYDKSALSDTIDAVVMGYDVGQGKRAGFGIGDFLIGVYESKRERFETVAKVGTGLTDDEWRRMKRELDEQKVAERPKDYEVKKEMTVDVWARPKIVVEIQADEITRSPMHSSGLALRFPRLVSFREKKPTDATSTSELSKMFAKQKK